MRFLAALFLLATAALAKPEQIRGVREPIYHLYLQAHPSDPTKVVLGPEASADTFEIGGTIESSTTGLFINIGDDSTSYKTLTFGEAGETTAWGLEGDTIITTTGSTYGRQLNFLVCDISGGYWEVFLQTGSDEPSDSSCSKATAMDWALGIIGSHGGKPPRGD
ncbi:hypothetical protein jhhlp_006370 [Lomentospora prolificans]|uniref:Uncharacterized protein n=1 Tax=Lomentospora prolificans TaxID=41688 RepID=A0A2N3N5W3_9PEZI|nr:hypothetical protein jhhlp_006370 [Lomentospora prolificans]